MRDFPRTIRNTIAPRMGEVKKHKKNQPQGLRPRLLATEATQILKMPRKIKNTNKAIGIFGLLFPKYNPFRLLFQPGGEA